MPKSSLAPHHAHHHPLLTPIQNSSARAGFDDLDLHFGAAAAGGAAARAGPGGGGGGGAGIQIHIDGDGGGGGGGGLDAFLGSSMGGAKSPDPFSLSAFPKTPLVGLGAQQSQLLQPSITLDQSFLSTSSNNNNSNNNSGDNQLMQMQQMQNHILNRRMQQMIPNAIDILLQSPMLPNPTHNTSLNVNTMLQQQQHLRNSTSDLYNIAYNLTPQTSGSSANLSYLNSPFVNSSIRDSDQFNAVSPLLGLAYNAHNNTFNSAAIKNNIYTAASFNNSNNNSTSNANNNSSLSTTSNFNRAPSAEPNQQIPCPFTTSICPLFPNAKALRDHVREHHQTDLVHSCSECGRGFLDLASLESHHCKGLNSSSTASFGHLSPAMPWTMGHGGSRRRSVSSNPGLSPFLGISGVSSGAAGGSVSGGSAYGDDDAQEKKRGPGATLITCEYEGCGKQFNLQKSYIVHLRTHTGEKPHICTYPNCNKAFAQPSGLRSHIFTHTGERPYKCTLCPKTYTTSSRLKIHFRAHTNEEPYACDFAGCSRRFKQKSNLDQHVVTHLDPETREKLQKGNRKEVGCAECGRMYKNFSSLDQHCWREHGRGAKDVNGQGAAQFTSSNNGLGDSDVSGGDGMGGGVGGGIGASGVGDGADDFNDLNFGGDYAAEFGDDL
ncbi:hypothetical protein BDR26DRAFT_919302 [Obelidium mucronatum]|nr:hypothetical protein BDR26DRAFT_919302 [Obelidium mucronatum]